MLWEMLQLAVRNLLRARARLLMTAGGVLIGTTAVVLLIALTFGLQRAAESGLGDARALTELQVMPRFDPNSGATSGILNLDNIQQIAQIPGVMVAVPFLRLQNQNGMRFDSYEGWADVMGVDSRYLPYLSMNAERGALQLTRDQAIAGRYVEESFFDPTITDGNPQVRVDLLTDRLTLRMMDSSGSERQRSVQINGIFSGTTFDYALLLPLTDVIALNQSMRTETINPRTMVYDSLLIRTTSREITNQVSDSIRELGFEVWGMGEVLNSINQFFNVLRIVLGAVGSVALLVAAFGVANTMTMAIFERTKEIGLMKAIGATDREILTIFLTEAALVGLLGGLSGLAVSLGLQSLINRALEALAASGGSSSGGFNPLPIDFSQVGGSLLIIPPELMLFAVGLASLVGVMAGLYPAIRAARMSTVTALKSD